MQKYFLIAGETSGDLHASRLIKQIRINNEDASFEGLGGDMMLQQGCRLHVHIREMAFMGIVDVLRHSKQIRNNFRIAKKALLDARPQVLILIDYPSFNLRMAEFCKKNLPKTKIVYYIPPKIWAWKTWRVHRIVKLCDQVLCIFPFEPDFYAKYGYKAEYVGNPTAEEMTDFISSQKGKQTTPVLDSKYIAVLPGSRLHEVKKCLPRMLKAALQQEGYGVVIAGMSSLPVSAYEDVLKKVDNPRIRLVLDHTSEVVSGAEAAIVNSGTATLEAALLGCPMTSVYHLNIGPLLYQLRPLLFSIPYFTLVNIIANKEVIREWLAYRFTIENVSADLKDILENPLRRQNMLCEFEGIRATLGAQRAAEQAAVLITKCEK